MARLAGLPEPVLDRAEDVLARLEASEASSAPHAGLADDLPLFAAARASPSGTAKTKELGTRKGPGRDPPDELSPREALDALYELRQRLAE